MLPGVCVCVCVCVSRSRTPAVWRALCGECTTCHLPPPPPHLVKRRGLTRCGQAGPIAPLPSAAAAAVWQGLQRQVLRRARRTTRPWRGGVCAVMGFVFVRGCRAAMALWGVRVGCAGVRVAHLQHHSAAVLYRTVNFRRPCLTPNAVRGMRTGRGCVAAQMIHPQRPGVSSSNRMSWNARFFD